MGNRGGFINNDGTGQRRSRQSAMERAQAATPNMMPKPALYPPVAARSVPVRVEEAEELARAQYRIEAKATVLGGEKDENFRLDSADASYVMKIAPASEPREHSDLITSVLTHLAEFAPALPVERILPAESGALEVVFTDAGGHERVARVTTFLEGKSVLEVPSTKNLRRQIGEVLARVSIALREFNHPALTRELIWDLQHAHRTRAMLDDLDDTSDYEIVAECLERFESSVKPRLFKLPVQAAHNDFNSNNILISHSGKEIAGVLDFGDLTLTHRINDVAIAAAEQLADSDNPLDLALDVVKGYHEISPLRSDELSLVYDLIRVRLAIIAIAAEWRARRFPDNAECQARRSGATRALSLLGKLPDDERYRQTAML